MCLSENDRSDGRKPACLHSRGNRGVAIFPSVSDSRSTGWHLPKIVLHVPVKQADVTLVTDRENR